MLTEQLEMTKDPKQQWKPGFDYKNGAQRQDNGVYDLGMFKPLLKFLYDFNDYNISFFTGFHVA